MEPNLSFFSATSKQTVPNFIDSIFVKDRRNLSELLEKSFDKTATRTLSKEPTEKSFNEGDDKVIHMVNDQ